MYRRSLGNGGSETVKVGIIGTGKVGQAIAKGLASTANEVRFGSRDPERASVANGTKVEHPRDIADWADVVILAVPFTAVQDAVRGLDSGHLDGKVLVDATNVLTASRDLALGFSTSGAEELAKLVPGAHVVKAFNTVFARNMSTGKLAGEPLALFVAGDDPAAKESVMQLGRDLGFEPLDAGPLRAARYLEPMGVLNISLAFGQKMGTGIGFRFLREPT